MKKCSSRGLRLAVFASWIFMGFGTWAAAQTASISGTVTGPLGMVEPLAGITVWACLKSGSGWDWTSYTSTDGNGQYEISGLAGGTYRVVFMDSNGNYVSETYDNIVGWSPWAGGEDILVPEGGTASGIDASLAIAAKITGTVTDGLSPLQNILVYALVWNGSWWEQVAYAWTDADGQYVLGVTAGTYRVNFRDQSRSYVEEVYNNISGYNYDLGEDILVSEGGTATGVDASLAIASKITGTVTGADGTRGLPGIYVYSYRWTGSDWEWAASDTTDETGGYELGGLMAGSYRVAFDDWNGSHMSETYDNLYGSAAWSQGTAIGVGEGATVSGIDARLDEYASLSGAVWQADGATPLAGVWVHLMSGAEVERSGRTGTDGAYGFSRVLPGSYTVRTAPVASIGFLGEWYDNGGLHVPGQNTPPPEATAVLLGSGENRAGIDFTLDPAGRITGTVTGGGAPLAEGRMKAKNNTYGLTCEGATGESGAYELTGLLPGAYTLKVGVDSFRDVWWADAAHEDQADSFTLAAGEIRNFDFDLAAGQNPALVEVTSDPSGAGIYLDYQATPYVTPAVVDVGEVASHSIWMGSGIASHVITIKKAGRPIPAPQAAGAVEAETVLVHFDLTADATGGVSVVTTPDGGSVYVDFADVPAGVSPVGIGNLAPGSHTILLRKAGCLQPRPITAWVGEDGLTVIEVPLTSDLSVERIVADVQSVPTNARVYVDYLPIAEVTDVVVDWMDPASHSGSGWHSATHTVMLRKPGSMAGAPRYVQDVAGEAQELVIHLEVDPASLIDSDGDGIPDWWWEVHGFNPLDHPDADAHDGSGMSYRDKMLADLIPGDPDSRFALDDATMETTPGSQTMTFVFGTVPGRRYVVQGAEDIATLWSNLSGVILATAHQTSCTIQIPENWGQHFYRLIVLVP